MVTLSGNDVIVRRGNRMRPAIRQRYIIQNLFGLAIVDTMGLAGPVTEWACLSSKRITCKTESVNEVDSAIFFDFDGKSSLLSGEDLLFMFSFALKNVCSRPTRSTLAVIGMTVAILGMVGLFSIAEGLDRAVGSTLERIPGLVAMQRGAPIPLFSTLPRSWTEELEAIPGVRAVSPECWVRVNVIDGKMVVSPPRLLCGSEIVRRNRLNIGTYRDDIIEGRYLEEQDVGTLHCVISKSIAEEHNKKVGDSIEVNGQQLKIVGIYFTGSILLDVAIIMDANRFRQLTHFNDQAVSSFYIEQDGSVPDEVLLQRIRDHFRGRGPGAFRGSMLFSGGHSNENPLSWFIKQVDRALKQERKPANNITGDGKKHSSTQNERGNGTGSKDQGMLADDPMEVRRAADWSGRINKFAEDLDLALGILTSLGLFIAVISIINTMLMSVTERISEFGILRANGWSKGDLIRLITFESLLLGVAGGMIGILSGRLLTHIINATFPARFELYASPKLLLFAFCFSAVLGVTSGLYPAIWAARLKPIEAIRRN